MITLEEYLAHCSCVDCKLVEWSYIWFRCPLLEKVIEDDGKVRTIKRSDCPIKKYRVKYKVNGGNQ